MARVPLVDVELATLHVVYCNSKKWTIQSQYLEDGWLQISASCYGLCNILNEGNVGKTPSLKGSKGLQSLLQKRHDHMASQEADGGDGGDALSRKRKKPSPSCLPPSFELNLGEHGALVIKRPVRATEDIKVLFNEENMKVFCNYMISEGCECVEPERRKYAKSASNAS